MSSMKTKLLQTVFKLLWRLFNTRKLHGKDLRVTKEVRTIPTYPHWTRTQGYLSPPYSRW